MPARGVAIQFRGVTKASRFFGKRIGLYRWQRMQFGCVSMKFRNRYTGIVRERRVRTASDCSDFSMVSDMRGQIETPRMDSRCSLIKRTGEDFYLASGRAARSQTVLAKCYIMRTVSVGVMPSMALFCQGWMPSRWRSKSTQGGSSGGEDQRNRFTGYGSQREQRSGPECSVRLAGAAYQSSLAL
jgi:hypothetical protein